MKTEEPLHLESPKREWRRDQWMVYADWCMENGHENLGYHLIKFDKVLTGEMTLDEALKKYGYLSGVSQKESEIYHRQPGAPHSWAKAIYLSKPQEPDE